MSTNKISKPVESAGSPVAFIERRIYLIRGQQVIFDFDLAQLYQVQTFNLNKAVRRNLDRFPDDFMFQLTREEAQNLTFQNGISSSGHGGRRHLPHAFTEHGVAMLSSVLNSQRAVQMNIVVVRAFVKIRELLASNKDLRNRVEKLEAGQNEHRSVIAILAGEIDELKRIPEPKNRRIM